MPRHQIARLAEIEPVECPCGQSRRAFVDDPDRIASLHVVEVTRDARTHYHKRLTEIYYVLEGTGRIELDGETSPIGPGDSILIKPGCRHRAIPDADTPLRVINVPVPAFDPDDEWFD
ncbi:Cupin domain protein [Planctomycetes bacterium MalM25]|nr:Cupin domain protein [Planctomycetes bacterium MalM25]